MIIQPEHQGRETTSCHKSVTNKAMMHATNSEVGLPGSKRGFVNRGRRKAGVVLHSVSLPLGEATPRHQREPQVILPTMYRQSSALYNTHTNILTSTALQKHTTH